MEINGKRVVDAKKAVTIHVTPLDVKTGDNKNPSSCAAAKAAKHSLSCISARVHIRRVYIEQKAKWVRYETPDSLRTEIIAFDKGGSFQPGDYTLRKVPPYAGSSRRRKDDHDRHLRAKSPQHPRKKLLIAKIKRHKVTGIRPLGANR
jgi:hypothetical protein